MKKLTTVAQKMGFSSLKDDLRKEFTESYKGYDIKVKRMSFSEHRTLADSEKTEKVYFTGYIYFNPNDEIFKNSESELEDILMLHGGITYDELETVEGQEYRVIGFDTAHYIDYMEVNTELLDFAVVNHSNLLGSLNIWNDKQALQSLRDAIDRWEEQKENKKEEE